MSSTKEPDTELFSVSPSGLSASGDHPFESNVAPNSHLKAAVLLVEDDADIARLITERLVDSGYKVWHGASVAAATALWEQHRPQVLLVDWMLPDGSGVDWVSSLRAQHHEVPICLLTARDALEDKLAGFDAGVDDYLPKPFALDELLVRVRALLKRSGLNREPDEGLTVGNMVLFEQERRVLLGGKTVVLTRREFETLFLLAQRCNKVVTREQLLNAWPGTREVNLNTIDVYISYLRKKLTGATVTIETVRGVGFRLIGASAP